MAAELGVTPAAASAMIEMLTGGTTPMSVFVDGIETDVTVQSGGKPIEGPGDLERVFLRADGGGYVPLSAIASFAQIAGVSQLSREGGDRAVPATAGLANGVELGVAAARARAAVLRLQPVLMTLASSVLDGLPLVLSSGAGAEARNVVGWVYRLIAPLGGHPGTAAARARQEMLS